MKGKLPFVHITALCLSDPQKLKKQTLKANFPLSQQREKNLGPVDL